MNSLIESLTSSITLSSTQKSYSLFQKDVTLPIFRPRTTTRVPVSAVPEPGAFLAFGAGALVIAASLRRRGR